MPYVTDPRLRPLSLTVRLLSDTIQSVPRLRFAKSAYKHRIAYDRVVYVIAHCASVLVQTPPEDDPDDNDERLVFLGDDQNGVPLEVMAIELEPDDGQDILLVIHAQKLRPKYRDDYERVRGY